MEAVEKGHLDVAEMLVDHGADMEAKNNVSLKRMRTIEGKEGGEGD